VSAHEPSRVAEETEPVALPGVDGTQPRQSDITQESTEAAADEQGRRSFSHRIGSPAVVLPLACVAAFLVGFGSMTALLRLGDRPAQSDTKPVVTTAAPVVPPSSAAPATTSPAAATRGPAIENEPAPAPAPPPESAPPTSAPAPALPPVSAPAPAVPPVSAPNVNPAGKAPPGQNR
jgi:hypothetical protein